MNTRVILSCQFATAYGGVPHSMLDLARYLDRTKFEPLVLCAPAGEIPRLAAQAGVQVRTVGVGQFWRYSHRQPLNTLHDLATVARAIVQLARTEKAPLVHAFDGAVFTAATLAKWQQPNLQVIWQDAGFDLYKYHFRLVMRQCFKSAARVTALSQRRLEQLLAEGLDPAKGAVTPLGTDFHLRSLAAAAAPALPTPETVRIGIVGRLVPIKNFELFLRAARRVADVHPQVQFVIVGRQGLFPDEVAYYHSLRRLIEELRLTAQVVMPGVVEDLASLMNTFDVLACSSHVETFGRMLIEAMALAKPVVATAVGAIPEVVVDGVTGLLTPPGDEAALAAALNRLAADASLRKKMGRQGYDRVLSRFDVRLMARQWEQIYTDVLTPPQTAPERRGASLSVGARVADHKPETVS